MYCIIAALAPPVEITYGYPEPSKHARLLLQLSNDMIEAVLGAILAGKPVSVCNSLHDALVTLAGDQTRQYPVVPHEHTR